MIDFTDCIKAIKKVQPLLYKEKDGVKYVQFQIMNIKNDKIFWGVFTPEGPIEEWYFYVKNGMVVSSFLNMGCLDAKIYTLPKYRHKGITKQFLIELYKTQPGQFRLPSKVSCLSEESFKLASKIPGLIPHMRCKEIDLPIEIQKIKLNEIMKELIYASTRS